MNCDPTGHVRLLDAIHGSAPASTFIKVNSHATLHRPGTPLYYLRGTLPSVSVLVYMIELNVLNAVRVPQL